MAAEFSNATTSKLALDASRFLTTVRSEYLASQQSQDLEPLPPFTLMREEIESSLPFQAIREMPKGGLLHVHSSVCGDASWIVANCTKYPNCFVEWPDPPQHDRSGRLFFSHQREIPGCIPTTEFLSGELGQRHEQELLEQLTFGVRECSPGFKPWDRFDETFGKFGSFTAELSVFRDYLETTFRSYIDDGIRYVELRCPCLDLTDYAHGSIPDESQFVLELLAIRDAIQQDVSAFEVKLILTTGRIQTPSDVEHTRQFLRRVSRLRARFSDVIVGVDFVGQEHDGNKIRDYWEDYSILKQEFDLGGELPLLLHAGETQDPQNSNLEAALQLGATRLAHGINLEAFPNLEQRLISQEIPLEICPISNQMLGYVRNLRWHPAAGYIRRGVPCVLGSDDPLLFGNHGLSFDFWAAWIYWGLSLSELKQLATNSLRYSCLGADEKAQRLLAFEGEWTEYLKKLSA